MNRLNDKHYGVALAEPLERTMEPPSGRDLAHNYAEGVLLALSKVVEQRDGYTAGHCERLASGAVTLGVAMGLDSASLLTLYLGGYLHDVGKVGIPDAILFKPGPLTEEEWEIMRSHPARGEAICRSLPSFEHVLPLIRSHHERMDGTGYPDRLAGDRIPMLARVIQTVDIYDALTNVRPYKDPCSRMRALAIMEEEMAKGWRDPEITSLFIHMNWPNSPMLGSLANLNHALAQSRLVW